MKNKKAIILIITLVLTIIGISYAAYTFVFTGGTNTLSTSDISLEFLESNSNIINITNALPMGCREGKQQVETFDFSVTSKTTRDVNIRYTLSIQKLAVDSGYTAFTDDQIALYLTDYTGANELLPSKYTSNIGCSTQEKQYCCGDKRGISHCYDTLEKCNSNDYYHTGCHESYKYFPIQGVSLVSQLNNYKLYTGTHTHDATHQTVQDKFKLRVWIAGDVDASNWNASTKLQYKFKIGLTSEEKQPSAYPEVVYRCGTNIVGPGTSLESVSGTKYVITNGNQDAPVGPYETQTECQTALEGFGSPEGYSCQQKTGTFGGFDYTEDYTTLNKSFFLKHNISSEGTIESSEVCYILNSTLYCLKGGDGVYDSSTDTYTSPSYESNKQVLNDSFGLSNCSVYSSNVNCSAASGLGAIADSDGGVSGSDGSSGCDVYTNGFSSCNGEGIQ